MKIILWRHGRAESSSPTGEDRDRVLSPEGRNDLIDVADAVFTREDRGKPQKIFSSPFARALESAETIQGYLACERGLEVLPELESGTPLPDLLRALESAAAAHPSLVLFGHMPDLGRLADMLLDRTPGETKLRPGGLLWLELDGFGGPYRGRLVEAVTPEEISG